MTQSAADRVPAYPSGEIDPVDAAPSLGDALRQAREFSGRSLNQLSTETRVHPRFLVALEQNDWSTLPSRVFAAGYVRAYAGALRLDETAAVERFKRDSPDTSTPLKAPIGIAFEDVRRQSPRVIAAVAVLAVAVIGWNIFQRASLRQAPHPSDIAAVPKTWAEQDAAAQLKAVTLNAPRQAPPDQTTPELYVTPGLEMQLTGIDPADPAAVAAAAALKAQPVQRAFNPRGAVYGAPATASQVVLQANKPTGLVVRTPSGQVLFARQLAKGESWRAPLNTSAVVDASEPTAFGVYLNGEHAGALEQPLTPLQTLNTRAAAMARDVQTQTATPQARAATQAPAQAQPATQAPPPAPIG
nr:helix-turn-helix transcriptional regulator [uncultured Brevundimonas sp.]